MQLIKINSEQCNLSYSCIRVCPVKAIKTENNKSKIIPSKCIGCGHCVTVCLQKAVTYRKETETVEKLLQSDDQVSALCDPAIAAEFTDISDYRKFVAMLRKLGFDYVHEVAFGVDLIARENKKLHNDNKGKYYISSKCPATVHYIEKYYPNLVENLTPLVTPYQAMGMVVKKKYGPALKTVYITACTAAKNDPLVDKENKRIIDAVITFQELREMFHHHQITEYAVQYSDFDEPTGRKGGLFPIAHGLLQAEEINQDLLNADILITDGRTGFLKSIEEFNGGTLNQHLDNFYCHGCFMGPGMTPGGKKFKRRTEIIQYVKKRLSNFDTKRWEKAIQRYSTLNFQREFIPKDKRLPLPDEKKIEEALILLGKYDHKEQLNCGACGYPTCREFAIATIQGLANPEMCYAYSTNKMQSYLKKLTLTNEKLKKTKQALKESEKTARNESQAAKEATEILKLMLHKLRSGVVLADNRLRIIEANTKFVEMMGDETKIINENVPGLRKADLRKIVPFYKLFENVLENNTHIESHEVILDKKVYNLSVFPIKPGQVVGGIIRDMKIPEVRKEEIIKKAREVIKENLKTVQKIAFLLGESAAKTEKTLNSIIEVQKLGEKKNGSR